MQGTTSLKYSTLFALMFMLGPPQGMNSKVRLGVQTAIK